MKTHSKKILIGTSGEQSVIRTGNANPVYPVLGIQFKMQKQKAGSFQHVLIVQTFDLFRWSFLLLVFSYFTYKQKMEHKHLLIR